MLSRPSLGVLLAASALTLAAFGPAGPTHVQQPQPKSWIPEQKPDASAPPRVVMPAIPKAAPPPGFATCPSSEPRKASKEFVEAYTRSVMRLKQKDFAAALALSDLALANTVDTHQKTAAWGVRAAAAQGLGDKAKLLEALEAQLAIGCLADQDVAGHRETIRSLRNDLGPPPL